MYRWLAIALCLCLAAAARAQSSPPPRFADYPAEPRHRAAVAAPVLQSRQDRLYRTRVREAFADGKVNFAGHYILSAFGCGSSCLMVFALDADSGRVSWLPFTVSWGLEDNGIGETYLPLDFRADSRLLVIAGSRNEHGHGLYHYVLEHGRFRLLQAKQDPPGGLWD